ncbi:MAG: RNA polymerase sigma factor region1.1 domain-containing protein, partial [Clostridia bacterium]
MDREQLLKNEIDKIIAMGRANGSVTEDEIMAKLEHLNATAEDMEVVFNTLKNENIEVRENLEEAVVEIDK